MMGEVIRVSGRAPDVGDLLREAMLSQRFADVALCCSGGQKFLAHRLVLSAASPYLQDVLLAHGKAAGYCEPITVILAEVEGPELAAILGFVYTGSATVPKSRLEAFARAAETLHVRIPPLPIPTFNPHHLHQKLQTSRVNEDYKLDNVKIEETKIDARYLRCEQYPPYEKWFNSTSWPLDTCLERLHRGEWKLAPHDRFPQPVNRSTTDLSKNGQFQKNFIATENWRKNDQIKLPEVANSGGIVTNELPITNPLHSGSISEEGSYELYDRGGNMIYEGDRQPQMDPFLGSDNSVSRMSGWEIPTSCRDEVTIKLQNDGETQHDNNDFEGRLATDCRSLVPSLPLVHRTTGRSSVTFEKQDYDAGGTLEAVGSSTGTTTTPSATVTSNIASNASISRATTCGESCCRWRSPRRHVANRVPASPWSQLARPAHNSPKIRTNVLRNREEINEPLQLQFNEPALIQPKRTSPFLPPSTFVDHPKDSSTSLPLNLHHKSTTSDSSPLVPLYGFQVPKVSEIPLNIQANSRYVDYVEKRQTSPDFYEASAYHVSSSFPIATISSGVEEFSLKQPSKEVVKFSDRSEPISACFDETTKSRFGPIQECSSNSSNIDEARGVIDLHAISSEAKKQIVNDSLTCNRRTSTRVELSHPISRLCDSVRLNGDDPDQETERNIPEAPGKEAIEINAEESRSNSGKAIFSMVASNIQSDSNNNDASFDGSILSGNVNSFVADGVETATTGSEGVGSSEDHKCEQCGKSFVTRASLKVHGRTHSGEKPFRCSDCGKEFSQLRNYKYHRSVHEGTREFAATCPECGKYFNDRGYLSSHMKIHRNRKEYACAECGKSFNQRVAYNMHVRIHTGVKPHQCEQCGKAFSRKMLLKQHLRTHSGERPYKCQICHKAFADRSNMTLHTRLHSGLKPYQCTLCSKAFTKKHHLKTHLNYHTGTKPYSCPNCSLRFSQSSNMRTHYKKCSAINSNSSNQNCIQSTNDNRIREENVEIVAEIEDEKTTGTSGPGRTNALTPPSSDQESSILTPIVEKRVKSTRVYSGLRSTDVENCMADT